MQEKTYYEVLGVRQDATPDEIRHAYRTLAMRWHPDRNAAHDAEEMFKAISRAYSILSDAGKRSEYDLSLAAQSPGCDDREDAASNEFAAQIFLEEVFDAAQTLAQSGYDREFILRALLEAGCPEAIASAAANTAARNAVRPVAQSTEQRSAAETGSDKVVGASAPRLSEADELPSWVQGRFNRSWWVALVGIFIGLFDLPQDYYMALHLTLFALSIYGWRLTRESSRGLAFSLGGLAFLYNPIFVAYLRSRPLWTVANLMTLVVFWLARRRLKEGNSSPQADVEREAWIVRERQQEADRIAYARDQLMYHEAAAREYRMRALALVVASTLVGGAVGLAVRWNAPTNLGASAFAIGSCIGFFASWLFPSPARLRRFWQTREALRNNARSDKEIARARRAEKAWMAAGLVCFLVVTIGGKFSAFNEERKAIPEGHMASTTPVSPPKQDQRVSQNTIDRIEGRYEELNPNSSRYEQRSVDAVLQIFAELVGRGIALDDAMDQAAAQVMSQRQKIVQRKESIRRTPNPEMTITRKVAKQDHRDESLADTARSLADIEAECRPPVCLVVR